MWGIRRREHHLQFPTLASACWVFYMLPLAFGSVRNPAKLPEQAVADRAITIALLMCILCAGATWYGWHSGLRRRSLFSRALTSFAPKSECHNANATYLFFYGAGVFLIGLWGVWELAALLGGFRAQFLGGNHYAIEWSGAPVKYTFFAVLVYPGFLFAFRGWLERKTVARTVIILAMALDPVASAVFLGRRGMTAAFALIIAVSIFFYCRWSVPPILMACLYTAAGVAVLVAPTYRTVASSTGNLREAAQNVNVGRTLAETLSGQEYSEFDALAITSAFYNRELIFDYGTSLYNGLINCLVPRQIVGEDRKTSLLIKLYPNDPCTPESVYGWTIPYGSNPTGPLDAFKSFWFFGAFMYFGLAWCLSQIWERASVGSVVHQLAYALLISPALGTIFASWTILPEALVKAALLLVPVYWIYRAPAAALVRVNRNHRSVARTGRRPSSGCEPSNARAGNDQTTT